jgi:hypothetical protein
VIGSEDCLYVNVFTKRGMEGDDAGLKKVLFWIHGGAFIFGGAQHYPATYIMEEDVVLVNQFIKEDSSNTIILKVTFWKKTVVFLKNSYCYFDPRQKFGFVLGDERTD